MADEREDDSFLGKNADGNFRYPEHEPSVRELVERLRRAARHYENAGAIAAIEETIPALESLLSRIAKLEERVRELSFRVKSVANHKADCACGECHQIRAALNRSNGLGAT
jgi:hypothetical protein